MCSFSLSVVEWFVWFFSGEKEPKPISGRVKEIAEFMLSCVMEKIVRKEKELLPEFKCCMKQCAIIFCIMRVLRLIIVILHAIARRSQWCVAVTGATSRVRSGGGFEAGIPGGWCSMLSGRPH